MICGRWLSETVDLSTAGGACRVLRKPLKNNDLAGS